MQSKGDFHVHTPFCPHGTDDTLESYVEAALQKGLSYLSFTEHAPLPDNFIDPVPEQDSAMKMAEVERYFAEVDHLKKKYKGKIKIRHGFEVDYIEGFEQETAALLKHFGRQVEDAILSVHMLKAPNGEYVCLDYSPEEFGRMVELFGSIDEVYKAYYETVIKSIKANLGVFKPKRVGHITLIEKFSKLFIPNSNYDGYIDIILQLIKENNYALDVNTAGLYKEYCGKSYPAADILKKSQRLNIPLIFGSDSHTSEHIGRGLDLFPNELVFSKPK
ncbi:MAG: histidinol-phosphatase HisJ [Tuberibacillus sp.]